MGELGGALAFFTIVVVRMMFLPILTIGTERTFKWSLKCSYNCLIIFITKMFTRVVNKHLLRHI